jgi:ATP-dependent Lhr-like helicase
MASRGKDSTRTDAVLSLLHPVVAEWFTRKFSTVTEAQGGAVPLIHAGRNVLVSSPTGSGKTLTAFLAILNELILNATRGDLENRIYAVYVSPLKALANDINENLVKPLAEISELFEEKGLEPPAVRVAVRTGDTLPSERQKQAKSPPHIFITTPESLALVLSTPVFSRKFEQVEYVIVDEVHDICDSKRGVALSIGLERLQRMCSEEFVRIGLSATVAPIDEVAQFLGGYRDGAPRPVEVVEVYRQRDLDLRVLCPTGDMTSLSFEVVNSKMYDLLRDMISDHRTTLVFTNTRSGTESVVYKLKERGVERIGTHHGSLSRETRLEVEDGMRGGTLDAVVSSTSLELGIDIGSIDLVVQIGSPKSVAKGLQRVGRAGHQYGGTSKGRLVVFENDDLVECAVLCRAAHQKMIDRVTIPKNSLDVLAQSLVGMSLERVWSVDEALTLLHGSYCYRDLEPSQLLSVLRYLGGKDEFEGVYSKIWYDTEKNSFGRRRGSRMIFYLNQGTIPEEADFKVFSERGALVGSLSEKFVERLSQGDIFVLGGRSYEFVNIKGTKAFVKSASGRKPTVPSWTGEMLPRSFDLSVLIGRFRGEMRGRLEAENESKTLEWLMESFDVDDGSARTICSYFREQATVARIPTDTELLIEGYVDPSGNRSAIFHFPFGRRVNDALSRAYASALSSKIGANVTVSVNDDCFMLTAPRNFTLEGLGGLVKADTLEGQLRSAIRDSELFSQRFRHTATRSFMVLRNYKGKEMSVARQQLRSQRLLDALHELEDFPVMRETYTEILTEVMDLEHAVEVVSSIERGDRVVGYLPFSNTPSPFAHNIILIGVSDIVLMEDRSMLLRDLHRKVLARVLGDDVASRYQFDTEVVDRYFRDKFPRIGVKADILEALRLVGPMNLFREKGESIYSHSDVPFEQLRRWAGELLVSGKVRSVWIGEDVYVLGEDHDAYACIHRRPRPEGALHLKVVEELERVGHPMDLQALATSLSLTRDDVREALRGLEVANRVFRSTMKGEAFGYALSVIAERPRGECIEKAVVRHLAYHAPISLEDIAYEIGVDEAEVEPVLRYLVEREAVASGRFVVGENIQYMLAKDYLLLVSKEVPSFDRQTVRSFLESKQFGRAQSLTEYLERFGQAAMMYDVSLRTGGLDTGDLAKLRGDGTVLLGRFHKGRVRYVLAKDAPYFLAAFRESRLNKHERLILRTLEKLESGTYTELAGATGLPSDMMRESFDSLDRKGHLLREYSDDEVWSSRNVYTPCRVQPADRVDGLMHVLRLFLRGFGPVTPLQAAAFLDVDASVASKLLSRIGAMPISVGLERTEMFAMPEDIGSMREFEEPDHDAVRVLSLYDPFLGDKWYEVISKYGEGWIFPVVHGGDIVGMLEKWQMAGALDVRDIRLDDPTLLGRVIEAMEEVMTFYEPQGVEIIRVRSALGTDVREMGDALKAEFTSRGYSLSNDMLVKGRLVTECFEEEDIVRAVISNQNLDPDQRLESVEDALERYGGIRSDQESVLRVERFTSVKRLHKEGAVVKGYLVPDRVGYCSREEAGRYGTARRTQLTPDQKLVLRIIKDQQPVRRDRLLTISPLGREDTVEAAKSLYHSSRIYLDGSLSYVSPPMRNKSSRKVWLSIIRRFFSLYGVMTAETLGTLLSGDLRMRQIRGMLRELEDEGCLVKGHLVRGSSTLFWASVETFERLGRIDSPGRFVLPPEDNLTQFMRAAFRTRMPEGGRHVVFDDTAPIGSFTGRVRADRLEVEEVEGTPECRRVILEYAKRLGLALSEGAGGSLSEWELMEFYEKTHPGARE